MYESDHREEAAAWVHYLNGEMYEALKQIAASDGESFALAWAKCVDIARAALAKTEGRQ